MITTKILGAALLLSTACLAQNKEEAAVQKRVSDFQDAWNKHDAKAIAAFWTEDGDLVDPTGTPAMGRPAVEKLVAADLANIIRDGKSVFTVKNIRFVKPDVIVLDMTHEITGAHAPDGSAMPVTKALVTGVGIKKGGTWMWVAGRPMIPFVPPAPPAAAPTK
jgi:uncharacterized protein (TIGR02246 family)